MVAHRLGEPFGTLVLTVSITIIEVGLIVMLMLGAEADKAALPRDTIFASIMIICNFAAITSLVLWATSSVRYSKELSPAQG